METQWCIFIFAVLWIHGCEMQIDFGFTPEFWRVSSSLNGTEGRALKMKIYLENRKTYGRDKSLQLNAFSLNDDMFQCHTKLLKILTDLGCPDLAKKLKPPLEIMEYLYNVESDENVLESYLEGNCTDLSGKSASTCKLMKSGPWNLFSFETLTSLIDKCRMQYNDRERESTRALSPRYQKEVF